MHELGIAKGIFDVVINTAKKNNAKKVNSVNVVYNASSAIIPEALIAAFDSLKELDEFLICKNAKIDLHIEESHCFCLDCANDFKCKDFVIKCPKCKGLNCEILNDKKFYIKNIVVES